MIVGAKLQPVATEHELLFTIQVCLLVYRILAAEIETFLRDNFFLNKIKPEILRPIHPKPLEAGAWGFLMAGPDLPDLQTA